MSILLVRLHSRLRPAKGRHTSGYTPEPWIRVPLPSQVDVFNLQPTRRYGVPYQEIS